MRARHESLAGFSLEGELRAEPDTRLESDGTALLYPQHIQHDIVAEGKEE